jgi:hypothetical protein
LESVSPPTFNLLEIVLPFEEFAKAAVKMREKARRRTDFCISKSTAILIFLRIFKIIIKFNRKMWLDQNIILSIF